MTVDDGIVIACIVTLCTALGALWKMLDSRYKTELAKRDTIIDDLVKRVRDLEDNRVPVMREHAREIRELADRYDATTARNTAAYERVAEAILSFSRTQRELAANVNANTRAIAGIKCRTFDQGPLPDAHPAADQGTEALVRNDPPTAQQSPQERRWRQPT